MRPKIVTGPTDQEVMTHFAKAFNLLAVIVNKINHDKGFYDTTLDPDTKTAIVAQVLAGLDEADFMITPSLERIVDKALDQVSPARNFGESLALMHSELSEALEFARKGLKDDKLPGVDGHLVELADCIIRILDWAGEHEVDLGSIIIDKIIFNQTREYKHGKRF